MGRPTAGACVPVLLLVLDAGSAVAQTKNPVVYLQSRGGLPERVLAPRDTPRGRIQVIFHVGGFDDGHEAGLTRVAQQFLVSGSRRSPFEVLMMRLREAGARFSTEVSVQQCSFSVDAPAESFERLSRSLLDTLLRPRLSRQLFDSARSRLLPESWPSVKVQLLNGLASAILSDDRFVPTLQADRAVAYDLTYRRVAEHIRSFFSPANATVLVVGPMPLAEMKALTARYRGGKRRPPVSEQHLTGKHLSDNRINAHIMIFPRPVRTPKEAALTKLLESILAETVEHAFRRKGSSYGTTTAFISRPWSESIVVFVPVDRLVRSEVETSMRFVVRDLRARGLTKATLRRNRAFLLERWRLAEQNPEQLAQALVPTRNGLIYHSPEVREAVEAATVADLRDVARRWLDLERAAHVVLGPRVR